MEATQSEMILEDPKEIEISVMKLRQPIGEIYIGKISSHDLYDIANFDIRRIHEEGGFRKYLGIQRELNAKRVATIQQYVSGPDASFPTSVVLAVEEQCVKLEPSCDEEPDVFRMTISNYSLDDAKKQIAMYRSIARVLDGQHRIAGLANYNGDDFEVIISIFVGADIADQAMIFSVVNLAQTKVNRSLVYDLFSFSKSRSPEKTAHNITVTLDRKEGSPFEKRIKRLGKTTVGRTDETLSQATVVNGILSHISGSPERVLTDRQIGLRSKRYPPVSDEEARKLVLRRLFVDDRDDDIVTVIWNYFNAVSTKWDVAWNEVRPSHILNRTNGYNALIRLFGDIFLDASPTTLTVPTSGDFLRYFENIPFDSDHFTTSNYQPGTSGSTQLYKDLLEFVRPKFGESLV